MSNNEREQTEMTKTYAEQYYVFTGPDGWTWCEMFYEDRHVTAPTPHKFTEDAMDTLRALHPDAMIDVLDTADVAHAMRYTFR